MKKSIVSFLAVVVLAVFLMSCVSMQDREMTIEERTHANIVGTVSAELTSFQFFHILGREQLRRRVHTELLRVARQQYGNHVEIRNITIQGRVSGWQVLYSIGIPAAAAILTMAGYSHGTGLLHGDGPYFGFWVGMGALSVTSLSGNFQRITATADVVMHGAGAGFARVDQRLVEAINTASETLINSIPQGATVAILNLHSQDPAVAGFVLDELEFRLVGSRRFSIVDRQRLEQIRREQDFHLSGEVSDASAVSIGGLLGASIVLTGDIGSDMMGGRLVLRALDVGTGQIVTMALERF